MSILRDALAERRAQLEGKIAEIDSDLAELERLLTKYGLAVTATAKTKKTIDGISIARRARAIVEKMITDRGRPVPFNELWEEARAQGCVHDSQNPRSSFGAAISQPPTKVYSIPNVGWWFLPNRVPAGLRHVEVPMPREVMLRSGHDRA